MPDAHLNTNIGKFSLAGLFQPSEDFIRFTQRLPQLVEPLLRQLATVAQALRRPLPEPQQRQVAALARLYHDSATQLAEVQRSDDSKHLSAAAAQLGQLISNASKQIAKEIYQPPRPPGKLPKPKDSFVRKAVRTLGDMPELQLWEAVKQLPGLLGTRRAQVTNARWVIFGHPPKGRPGKTPKKPSL